MSLKSEYRKARQKVRDARVTPPPGGVNYNAVMTDRYLEAEDQNQGSFSSNFKYMLKNAEGDIPGFNEGVWNEQKQEEDRIAEEQQAAEEAARAAANAPKPIPLPDDDYIRTQRKKSLARQRRRGGRLSTILTPYNDRESLG